MGETPKDFLKRRKVQHIAKADAVLRDLGGNRVLFYPYAGRDWNPLQRLSHLCNVFVYAVPDQERADIDRDIRQTFSVSKILMAKINSETMKDLGLVHDMTTMADPWAVVAKIDRTVGPVNRELTLFYICCCPILVHQRLFTDRQVAPKVLCLRGGDSDQEKSRFAWSGPIGTAVAENAKAEPQLVIRGREAKDWPWTRRWQEFAAWNGGRAYATPCGAEIKITPNAKPGKRLVVVSRSPLTPAHVGDSQAVLISVALLRQYQWPRYVRVLVDMATDFQLDARTQRLNPEFTPVQVSGLPLAEALRQLEDICEENNIQQLASLKLGFEDEGPELGLWRSRPGHLTKLTLHCPLEGDVFSFGPFADRIE